MLMPRKPNEHIFDALFELATFLPWWAGVLFAIAIYFALHAFAVPSPVGPMNAQQAGGVVSIMILKAAAGVLQYMLPPLFLAGAAVSAWQRSRRRRK